MTEIHVNNSDSDISTGSWTLIDDSPQEDDKNSLKSSDSSVEIIEIDPETDEEREEKKPETDSEKEDGFLAFDEFMQEKLMEYDYEHVEKAQKIKKKNKGRKGARKFTTQSWGISVFITIILALTAFATLCSTLSQNDAAITTAQVPNVRQEVGPSTIKLKEDLFLEINESLKKMEKDSKLLEEMESKLKNTTFPQCPRNMNLPRPKVFSPKIPTDPLKAKVATCSNCKNTQKQNKIKSKNKTSWLTLKEFLLDTNFHALVSLIMTNIYLFSLLIDITKRPSNKSVCAKNLKEKFILDLKKNKEELRKCLFKELPFWKADIFDRIPKNSTAQKSTNTSKTNSIPSKKPSTLTVVTELKKTDSVLFTSCPFIASSRSLLPAVSVEAGKSECQRRFDELDFYQKKFEELRESQRNRIKLLKQKFRNEVSYIRDTEEQADMRAEKINKTSQRFIRKLKLNREKYLLELKKVKELRQRVADTKKKEKMKDIATGSYVVSLPSIYDYGQKFATIKEKFEKESGQLPKEYKFH